MIKQTMALILLSFSVPSLAGVEAFTTGPVFTDFGENAVIQNGLSNPSEKHFKVAFDIAKGAENDAPNRNIGSVARFINMHVRAGVPIENIQTVIIVHGPAAVELLSQDAYTKRLSKPNPSYDLLQALIEQGVEVVLCGQSAAFANIAQQDLMPGVQMSLSAMTAHALYQQQGFTLNPF